MEAKHRGQVNNELVNRINERQNRVPRGKVKLSCVWREHRLRGFRVHTILEERERGGEGR